jgi:transposase, IS5 family
MRLSLPYSRGIGAPFVIGNPQPANGTADRPMADAIRRANATKSKISSYAEYVFAEQKDRIALFIRTIGIARARVKIGMANMVYNFKRLLFLRRTAAA